MERREWLGLAGAATLATMASRAVSQSHEHHGGSHPYAKLIAASAACVEKGQICLAHCLDLLGKGDSELSACAQSVNQLVSLCDALHHAAATESKYLRRLAGVVVDACKDCEHECRKHEKKYPQCSDCAQSCAVCVKECQAVAI